MDNAHNPNKGEYATPTLELGLWLRALRSFFDLENLPLNEAARASILKHDFTCEVSITRAVLLRCLGLVGKLAQPGHAPDAYDANDTKAAATAPGTTLQFGAGELSDDGFGASLPALSEILNDACLLGEGLLGAPAIRFG